MKPRIGKRVLITGAGGLIGGHAAVRLHEAGYLVTGLYRTIPDGFVPPPWTVVEGDLLQSETVAALARMNFDVIVHCAAVLPTVPEGEEARRAAEANRRLDDRVLDVSKGRIATLIYASSTSVYGPGGAPWSEASPVAPLGPYAAAKLATEERIAGLGLRSVILRISAPYGPRQRPRTVLKTFIERAMANLDLYYYGTGERKQDFTAAEDVARAIAAAISLEGVSGVFNIAGGKSITMRELAELVVSTVPGTTSMVAPLGHPDPQESYRAAFDLARARDKLRWTPSIPLNEGIRRWVASARGQR